MYKYKYELYIYLGLPQAVFSARSCSGCFFCPIGFFRLICFFLPEWVFGDFHDVLERCLITLDIVKIQGDKNHIDNHVKEGVLAITHSLRSTNRSPAGMEMSFIGIIYPRLKHESQHQHHHFHSCHLSLSAPPSSSPATTLPQIK